MWVGSSWRVDGHLSVSRAIGKALFRMHFRKYTLVLEKVGCQFKIIVFRTRASSELDEVIHVISKMYRLNLPARSRGG